MSAATDLFVTDVDPAFDPDFRSLPTAPRRHLTAVPDGSDWSDPVTTALRRASVATLHAPEPEVAPLRLTRRGIVVLALFVATLGAALVWVAALSNPGDAPAAAPVSAATVTVQSGDTLWSIASRVAPEADPRAEVDTLRRLNGLDDAALVPGQTLRTR